MPPRRAHPASANFDTADGSLEFIGEDTIRHTPKDEEVLVKMGHAFDVVGERKQTDFNINVNGHVLTESYEIKACAITRTRPWTCDRPGSPSTAGPTGKITKKSSDYKKQDSRMVHFPITIPKDGEGVVTYTVKYTW